MYNLISVLLLLFLLPSCSNKKNKLSKTPKLSIEQINDQLAKEARLEIDSIGILVYDKFFEIDAIGPYQVLSSILGTKVFFVALEKGVIEGSSGVKLNIEHSIDEIDHLDILLVPGGTVGTVIASENEEIISWIQSIDKTY